MSYLRIAYPFFFWFSMCFVATAAGSEKPEFERARILATNICSVCHLFPAPETLDRNTWSNRIIPSMREKMGVAALENNPSADARVLI